MTSRNEVEVDRTNFTWPQQIVSSYLDQLIAVCRAQIEAPESLFSVNETFVKRTYVLLN